MARRETVTVQEADPMAEQGAVLFLNEEDGVWELVTIEPDDAVRV